MDKVPLRKITLTYFKRSGKYYSHEEFQVWIGLPEYRIYETVRYWGTNQPLPLPGLSTKEWDGFILVEPEDGVPALIDSRDGE